MTRKQKLTVAVLAIINVVVILALARLALRAPAGENLSVPLQETCQLEAAQALSQAGVGGTVVLLPAGQLCFEIPYSLAPGEMPDQAAQLAWPVFDAVSALREGECEFTSVEVVILAQGSVAYRIEAKVGAADLVAFYAGELSEDEFVERVDFTVSSPPQ